MSSFTENIILALPGKANQERRRPRGNICFDLMPLCTTLLWGGCKRGKLEMESIQRIKHSPLGANISFAQSSSIIATWPQNDFVSTLPWVHHTFHFTYSSTSCMDHKSNMSSKNDGTNLYANHKITLWPIEYCMKKPRHWACNIYYTYNYTCWEKIAI